MPSPDGSANLVIREATKRVELGQRAAVPIVEYKINTSPTHQVV